MYWLYKHSNQ